MSTELRQGKRSDLPSWRLLRCETAAEIEYSPVEVSKLWLGIVTEEQLAVGERMVLKLEGRDIDLSIADRKVTGKEAEATYYSLMADDPTVDMEPEFLRRLNFDLDADLRSLRVRKTKTEERSVRAARFSADRELVVYARAFGAQKTFQLCAINVSKSGLLLVPRSGQSPPLRVNTFVELTIDPELEHLPQAIRCVGRIVRQEHKGDGIRLGTKIVDMRPIDIDCWSECVEDISQSDLKGRKAS